MEELIGSTVIGWSVRCPRADHIIRETEHNPVVRPII